MNRTPTMSASWRGKLLLAILVLAFLTVLSIVHGATAVHGWFEAQESLAHWQERLQETPEGRAPTGFASPRQRIARLETEAQQHVERLLLSVGLAIFSGTLTFFGVRAWKNA